MYQISSDMHHRMKHSLATCPQQELNELITAWKIYEQTTEEMPSIEDLIAFVLFVKHWA